MNENNEISKNSSVSYTNEEADDFSVIEKRYSNITYAKEETTKEEKKKKETDIQKVKQKKEKKILKKIIITVLITVVAVLAAFSAYAFSLPKDKIVNGIKINGVYVGGMTAEEASELLEKVNTLSNNSFVLRSGEVSQSISTAEINAQLDKDATVKKAFSFAKSKNPYANAINALPVMFSGKNINPVITYDYDLLANIVNSIGEKALGGLLTQHSVRFAENNKAYITPGCSGYDSDPKKAMEQIDDALKNSISNEIVLDFDKKEPNKMTIDTLDALVYQLPENASYALENGQIKIIPEKVGRYINKDECLSAIESFEQTGLETEFTYYSSAPDVTEEILASKLFNAQLGSYTTRFNAGSVNRSANIANAASKINGKILLPGEIFSFNETVGHRTVANGFKTAPEYQNGQTVDGIGGGTCQVSTTVYSAALYADLKIVKRSNHSMAVSYVPLGQDATVTDGGLDLKFENNTDYPIKLNTAINGGSITISVTGTAPDTAKTVKLLHTPVPASSGKAVKTERQVFDSAGTLIRTDSLGTSRYKPHGSSASVAAAPAATQKTEQTKKGSSSSSGSKSSSSSNTSSSDKKTSSTSKPTAQTQKPDAQVPSTPKEEKKSETSSNSTPVKTE